jgi:hypothetical protein
MSAPPNAPIVLMKARGNQSSAGENVSDIAKLSKWCLRLLKSGFLSREFPGFYYKFQLAQISSRSGDFADLPFADVTPDRLAVDSLADVEVPPCTNYMPRHPCTTFSSLCHSALHSFSILP